MLNAESVSLLRGKAAGVDEDQSPSFSAEFTNVWSYASTPLYDFMSLRRKNPSSICIWTINFLNRSSQYCLFIIIHNIRCWQHCKIIQWRNRQNSWYIVHFILSEKGKEGICACKRAWIAGFCPHGTTRCTNYWFYADNIVRLNSTANSWAARRVKCRSYIGISQLYVSYLAGQSTEQA